MNKQEYIMEILHFSRELLNKLPIELEPKPLEYALGILKPEIEKISTVEIEKLTKIKKNTEKFSYGNANRWQGLNTIGMLMDRFTILIIREWSLRNKINKNEHKADLVYEKQTLDIIEAIINAAPGSSSLNAKITNIKATIKINTWEEAFYGLLTTNLILWESQEVLYIKDIKLLPCDELRDYIDWFSKGNIVRNEYIEFCETFFWTI